ncbi:MAG: flagellar hook-basal body protein [Ignavibacteriaceae bacterium]
MIKGIYLSSRTLEVKSKNIDTVASNIANINTTGYKRQLPFSEVLMTNGQVNVKQYTDFRQGELVATNSPLDAAIEGDGYFTLKTEDGTQYTRNGKFKISNEGFLINEQGFKVLGHGGEINIFEFTTQDQQDIKIKSNGEIKVGETVVDSLLVVRIEDEQNTARLSGLNFAANEVNVSVLNDENYKVHQGYIEGSNVNPVVEMESMIRLNNEYESAAKMMKYLDQSLSQANQIGKL